MTKAPHPAKRGDRLFELVRILRDGRAHRAEDLAEALGVTMRTIYRDMDTLQANGVPVVGTRGSGYQMTEQVTLPPLNLTMKELEALHLGVAVLTEAADPALADAARMLADKIDAALPEGGVAPQTSWGLGGHPFGDTAAGFRHMPTLRAALRARNKVRLRYRRSDDSIFEQVVWPLKLDYWGRVWTLTAWGETSQGFEELRADRIDALEVMSAVFEEELGKSLDDLNRS